MSKPDKLPTLDPCQRGIFEVIVATAADLRKQRRLVDSMSYSERKTLATHELVLLKAREARHAETELLRIRKLFMESGGKLAGPITPLP